MPQELATAIDWHISIVLSYFAAPFQPQMWTSWLAIPPTLGILALLYAVTTGLRRQDRSLWWFATPLLVLHLFLIPISDLHLLFTEAGPWLIALWLLTQLASLVFAGSRATKSRLATAALTLFTLTYLAPAVFWAVLRHFNGPPAPAPYQFFS